MLPYTPRSRDRSREAGSSKGDTHIWVLRAQCWLRGGEAWGREERQRNRRTGLSPEGLRPAHRRPGTRLGGRGLWRTPGDRGLPSNPGTLMWLPGKLSTACLGQHQTQTMLSTPAKAKTAASPQGGLPRDSELGWDSGPHAMRAAGLAPASQRVAVSRREATPACPPRPGQAARTLTVSDVPETLGIQQVPQPGHLVLQFTDQLVVRVLVDDGVTADLFGPVGIPGRPRELWAVPAAGRPKGAQSSAQGRATVGRTSATGAQGPDTEQVTPPGASGATGQSPTEGSPSPAPHLGELSHQEEQG